MLDITLEVVFGRLYIHFISRIRGRSSSGIPQLIRDDRSGLASRSGVRALPSLARSLASHAEY